MALTKRTLKGLIEYSDLRNTKGIYSEENVTGVSTDKRMIPTKANLDGVNLKEYKLFPPGYFAFVADTSRRGDKIALAYNDTERTYIVSTWYVVFSLRENARDFILPDYLFLFLNRTEFDRYARANSWGSAREYFWFSDMEDVPITLPSIDTQQRFVDIYKSMNANQQSYEQGLDDLKLAFDVALDKLKHSEKTKTMGNLLYEVDQRNSDGRITDVQGINITKQFMPSVANTTGVDLKKYKLVTNGQFAYSGMQTGRDECIRLALYQGEDAIIISPAYTVFECEKELVLPEFIMMWFSRSESDRRGWFMSDGSIRTNLDLDRLYEIKIPLPDMNTQQSIVNIYTAYITRRRINEQLKSKIKDICPVLIRGSLEYGG